MLKTSVTVSEVYGKSDRKILGDKIRACKHITYYAVF